MAATKHDHRCGECNRPAKVLMRIGTDPEDWVYATCDGCLDELCARHAEDAEDRDGRTLCETCYQAEAMRCPKV